MRCGARSVVRWAEKRVCHLGHSHVKRRFRDWRCAKCPAAEMLAENGASMPACALHSAVKSKGFLLFSLLFFMLVCCCCCCSRSEPDHMAAELGLLFHMPVRISALLTANSVVEKSTRPRPWRNFASTRRHCALYLHFISRCGWDVRHGDAYATAAYSRKP